MKRAFVFANRNFKEMRRDVISWIFCIGLPLVLLVVCKFIFSAIPDTPQNFLLQNFSGGILVFSFSFVMLFCGTLVAKDRASSFLKRLYVSPMKAKDFILGYVIASLPIVLAQTVAVYALSFVFGLDFSWDILLGILLSLPSAFMYISLGLLFGCCFNDKAVSGMSSLVLNVAALLSGMWFDLSMIGTGFSNAMHILPFANAVDVINFATAGLWSKVWLPFAITTIWATVLFALAVITFGKKSKK